jgi:hypothetical protein
MLVLPFVPASSMRSCLEAVCSLLGFDTKHVLKEPKEVSAMAAERKKRRKDKAALEKRRSKRMARRKAAKKQILVGLTVNPNRARYHRSKKVNNSGTITGGHLNKRS